MSPKKWFASQKEAWVFRFQSQSIGVQKRQMLLISLAVFLLSLALIVTTNSWLRLPQLPKDTRVYSIQKPMQKLQDDARQIQAKTAGHPSGRPDSDTLAVDGQHRLGRISALRADTTPRLSDEQRRRILAYYRLQHGSTLK